jgi:hypothetical protein
MRVVPSCLFLFCCLLSFGLVAQKSGVSPSGLKPPGIPNSSEKLKYSFQPCIIQGKDSLNRLRYEENSCGQTTNRIWLYYYGKSPLLREKWIESGIVGNQPGTRLVYQFAESGDTLFVREPKHPQETPPPLD